MNVKLKKCGCYVEASKKDVELGTAFCGLHFKLGAQEIEHTNTHEWCAWCTDCTWTRWCGQSENTANILAGKHANITRANHYTHVAYEWRTNNPRQRAKLVFPPHPLF